MVGRRRPGGGEGSDPIARRFRPDESVLDELSRAFGVQDDSTTDSTAPGSSDAPASRGVSDPVSDNADLIADDTPDTDPAIMTFGDDFDGDAVDGLGDDLDDFDAGFDAGFGEEVGEIHLVVEPVDAVTPHSETTAAAMPDVEVVERAPLGVIKIGGEHDGIGPLRPLRPLGTDRSHDIEGVSGLPDSTAHDDRPAGGAADEWAADGDAAGSRQTIAIGGDDLPDAVYLEDGDLVGGDDSAGTVFIDDDGTGDAVAIKDATAQGIEPRLRQRRIGVRRAASRKRIKWVVLGATVTVLVLGVLLLLGSGLFSIDEVDVTGNVYTDPDRLAAIVDELEGTPVLVADTEAAERELEAIPWVQDARVRTRFPNSATIEIRERKPVATIAGADGRFRVLDATGRVLDVIDGQPVAYVLLGGPTPLDLEAGAFYPLGPSEAASLVTKLTPSIRPRVQLIEVTDDGADLVMYLGPAPVVPPAGETGSETGSETGDETGNETGGDQISSIRVRFGSAIGDNDQIEKLVRLQQKLDDLDGDQVTEINVATDEVTEL